MQGFAPMNSTGVHVVSTRLSRQLNLCWVKSILSIAYTINWMQNCTKSWGGCLPLTLGSDGGSMKKLLLVICLAALMATSAFAGQLIVKGGFETGSLAPGLTVEISAW